MVKTLAIIAFGVILQLSAVWFLGSSLNGGTFFCCRGVPDDIYHLALTNELVSHFPPQEPGESGVIVKNYHYLANLVMADFIRIFHLPLAASVYQYFAVLVSVLMGLTVIVIAQLLDLGNKITRWWLIFLYFNGDILYLLLFLRGKGLNFDVTIFDDATKLLAGPPRSFSLLLLFTGLALFVIWIKKRYLLSGILIAIIFGSLIGFKVYTGLFAMAGMAAIGAYYLFRRDWKMILPPLMVLCVSLAVYLPVNGLTGGLIFNGSYRFDDFISQPVFGLTNLELWEKAGAWYLEPLFFAAYLIFLYGTSLLALFQTRKTLRFLPRELNIFLLTATTVTAIVGLFFVQNIGGLNSVQFLISLYFVGALYAALAVSRWPLIIGLVVILLTLPRPLHEVWGNMQMLISRQGFFVSADEMAALNYLKNQTPANAVVALPPDLARQEVSLYVSFLANRPLYVAGYIGVLQDHQVPGAAARLAHPDYSQVDYLYLPKKYSFYLFPGQTVFENHDAKIIRIPKTVNKSANSLTGVSVK
ncbi:MAG: hypothetical protein M1484_00435 [Patescibacteria group bacterium]|nr:hypothetical protein [Patescibacteria group bacterium]MCL5431547.1 hypothetical protein [Patescibacteria group bacterium]